MCKSCVTYLLTYTELVWRKLLWLLRSYNFSNHLASLIPNYVQTRALRSSSSLSVCVPPRKTTMADSKSFSSESTFKKSNTCGVSTNRIYFHLLLQTSGIHCQIIFRPFQFFLLLEELSNIIYFCLLTLTVVQNLARSNQLNVSHLVRQCQLLPLHSSEIPCRSAKSV